MKNFVDESGSFSWGQPGVSLFCGVTVPDRAESRLIQRFLSWKRSIIGNSRRELKGEELTANQLHSFSYTVLPPSDRDVWLTVVGADTRRTKKAIVETSRDQASQMFDAAAALFGSHDKPCLQETFRQMSGWASNRSPENVLWIYSVADAILQMIQHFIIRFTEPEHDCEFEQIRIAIDQSFVRRDEHVIFWREWLRTELMGRSHREATVLPDTWREREHPFLQKYEMHPGLLNLNSLFVRNTGFFQSHTMVGLQIADICAHICYRYQRGEDQSQAYWNLRPRIVGRDGCEIYLIHLDENCLHKDDVKNHVGIFDIEEWKTRATKLREKRSSPPR